jgi:hypothetical protein
MSELSIACEAVDYCVVKFEALDGSGIGFVYNFRRSGNFCAQLCGVRWVLQGAGTIRRSPRRTVDV